MCGARARSKTCSARTRRRFFGEIYDVTPGGNFEGHTILNRINSLELHDAATEAAARRRCGQSFWRAAGPASAPASTTRCLPIGTA